MAVARTGEAMIVVCDDGDTSSDIGAVLQIGLILLRR
jgi:hypothetical protein